jgi:hypothetical protein
MSHQRLAKKKVFFFKTGEQEDKIGPVWELVPVGDGGEEKL